MAGVKYFDSLNFTIPTKQHVHDLAHTHTSPGTGCSSVGLDTA